MKLNRIVKILMIWCLFFPSLGLAEQPPDNPGPAVPHWQNEAQKEYIRLFQDLSTPYSELIAARTNLRQAFIEEQELWGKMLKQKPLGSYTERMEESSLREKAFPSLADMSRSLEELFLKESKNISPVKKEKSTRGPEDDRLFSQGLKLDLLLNKTEAYSNLMMRTIDRLNVLHQNFLNQSPSLSSNVPPSVKEPLKLLQAKRDTLSNKILQSQQKVSALITRFRGRLGQIERQATIAELKTVQVLETLAERTGQGLRSLTSASSTAKETAGPTRTLQAGLSGWAEKIRRTVSINQNPYTLDQETVAYLPPLSNDPELIQLRGQRERTAQKLRQMVDQHLGHLDPLLGSIQIRNQILQETKPFLRPQEANQNLWHSLEDHQKGEQSLINHILQLRSRVQQTRGRPAHELLASREESAAFMLLGRAIKSLAETEVAIIPLVATLVDQWSVPVQPVEVLKRLQLKRDQLKRLLDGLKKGMEALEAFDRFSSEDRKVDEEIQAYVERLNELKLQRITKAKASLAAGKDRPGISPSLFRVINLVDRFLNKQQKDLERYSLLTKQIRTERTKYPLLHLEEETGAHIWTRLIRTGAIILIIEKEVLDLKQLPGQVEKILDLKGSELLRLQALLEMTDHLGFWKEIGEENGGFFVRIGDDLDQLTIKGIGGDRLLMTNRSSSGLRLALFSPDKSSRLLLTQAPQIVPPPPPPPPPPPGSMPPLSRGMRIAADLTESTVKAVWNNSTSYLVLTGVDVTGALLTLTPAAPLGVALIAAAKAGLVVTAIGDVGPAVSKVIIREVNPRDAGKYEKYIDNVKSGYDVVKVFQTIKNIKEALNSIKGLQDAYNSSQQGAEQLQQAINKLNAENVGRLVKDLGNLLNNPEKTTGVKLVRGLESAIGSVAETLTSPTPPPPVTAAVPSEETLMKADYLIASARAAVAQAQESLAAAKTALASAKGAAGLAGQASGFVQNIKSKTSASGAACQKVVPRVVTEGAKNRAVAAANQVGSLYQEIIQIAGEACSTASQSQSVKSEDARRVMATKIKGLVTRAQSRASSAETSLKTARSEAGLVSQQNANRLIASTRCTEAQNALATAGKEISGLEEKASEAENKTTQGKSLLATVKAKSSEAEQLKKAALGIISPYLADPQAKAKVGIINSITPPASDGLEGEIEAAKSIAQQAKAAISAVRGELNSGAGRLSCCDDAEPFEDLGNEAAGAVGVSELFMPRIQTALNRAVECQNSPPGSGPDGTAYNPLNDPNLQTGSDGKPIDSSKIDEYIKTFQQNQPGSKPEKPQQTQPPIPIPTDYTKPPGQPKPPDQPGGDKPTTPTDPTKPGINVTVVGTAPPGKCTIVTGQLVAAKPETYPKKISGMPVVLTGPVTKTSTSSGSGAFSFQDIPAGKYVISVQGWNWGMTKADFVCESGKAVKVELKGSCPYLYVWTGSSFEKENDIYPVARLLPQDLLSDESRLLAEKQKTAIFLLPPEQITEKVIGEKTMRDYYRISRPMKADEQGNYRLKIVEQAGEHSFTDLVRLMTIDHRPGTQIGITREGQPFILEGLQPLDGFEQPQSLYNGDALEFTLPSQALNQGVIGITWQGFLDGQGDGRTGTEGRPYLALQRKDPQGQWQTMDWVYPRDEVQKSFFLLKDLGPGWDRGYTLRLVSSSCEPHKYHRLDQIVWGSVLAERPEVTYHDLLSAVKGSGEDVLAALRQKDGKALFLEP